MSKIIRKLLQLFSVIIIGKTSQLNNIEFMTIDCREHVGIPIKTTILTKDNWVILLNLVHIGNIQLLAIFHNLAANEHWFLPENSKISINTPK